MKNILLLISLIITTLLFAQTSQNITSEAYNVLKVNGQLDQNVRYSFIPSGNQPSGKLTKKDISIQVEKSFCSCLVPLDTTFSLVPFISSVSPTNNRNDDDYTNKIGIPFSFNFYGVSYDSLYINNNGNISFLSPYYTFTANSFPDSINNMIAAFWGDVDTRDSLSGMVYYKITPTAMIIKWEQVGYFNIHSDKLNTFQLTISNGLDPMIPDGNNVSFCYGDMQWTTGDASGGAGGFAGVPATVGVNQGNGIDYFQVGTFDTLSIAFDGPYNTTDGIDFLDNQEIYFNLALPGNVPPLILSSYICDTIDVYTGDTLKSMHIDSVSFVISVMTPEVDQIVEATLSCDQADHFTYFKSKDTPTFKEYTCTFYATNLLENEAEQLFYVTVNATDNWIPAGESSQTVVIRSNYQNSLSLENKSVNDASVSIYPNPNDGIIVVKHAFAAGTNPSLSIQDVSGKNVFSAELLNNSEEVDVSSLVPGVYFATISANHQTPSTIKIIKK